MVREREPQDKGVHAKSDETIKSRPLTHGEFYLAMTERPDPNGLGLRPELRSLFVGQERAYKELYEAITQSPPGTVVVITAPFGAGKDALMDVVTTDLVVSGRIQQDEKDIKGKAVMQDGKEIEIQTEGFREGQKIDREVDGENYKPFLNRVEDFQRVEEKARNEYLERVKMQEGVLPKRLI